MKTDLYPQLLRNAYYEASASPDSSTQNGALLVNNDGAVLSRAHNRPSEGLSVGLLHPVLASNKYYYMEHAERGAIYAAARAGIKTDGTIMVATWAACYDCARAIVHAGVKCLIRHDDASQRTPERWRESIEAGDLMMRAAGVKIVDYVGHVGAVSVRLDSQAWMP